MHRSTTIPIASGEHYDGRLSPYPPELPTGPAFNIQLDPAQIESQTIL
jgi:hypothetical protein